MHVYNHHEHVLQPTDLLPPKSEPPVNYPVYIGIYDCDSQIDDELSFKKDDLMYLIDTDEDGWWFVRLNSTGEEGYIPSNYVAEYRKLDAEE